MTLAERRIPAGISWSAKGFCLLRQSPAQHLSCQSWLLFCPRVSLPRYSWGTSACRIWAGAPVCPLSISCRNPQSNLPPPLLHSLRSAAEGRDVLCIPAWKCQPSDPHSQRATGLGTSVTSQVGHNPSPLLTQAQAKLAVLLPVGQGSWGAGLGVGFHWLRYRFGNSGGSGMDLRGFG